MKPTTQIKADLYDETADEITAHILGYLRARGYVAWAQDNRGRYDPKTGKWYPHPNNRVGVPDILGYRKSDAKFIGVEVKAKLEAEVTQPNQAALPLDIDATVESEALITSEQLKSLQTAYGSRLKFSTPEDRHDFATWFLSLPVRLRSTKALTEDQATVLLDTLGSWDASAVEQTLTEFRRWQTTQAPFSFSPCPPSSRPAGLRGFYGSRHPTTSRTP